MPNLTRLDDAQGLKALAKGLQACGEKLPDGQLLGAYLESWAHPWLKAFGLVKGFLPTQDSGLTMEHRTGHFDHAPYALHSCFGIAYETPYETEHYGRVYLVEYKPAAKARQILFQVQEAIQAFRDKLPLPDLRKVRDSWLGEALDSIDKMIVGMGTEAGCGRCLEHGLRTMEGGAEAYARLQDPVFLAQIHSDTYGFGSPSGREALVVQLKRIPQTLPVFEMLRADWPSVIAAEEEDRKVRHAALLSSAS